MTPAITHAGEELPLGAAGSAENAPGHAQARRDGARVARADEALQAPGLVLQVLQARVMRKITCRHKGLLSVARRPHAEAGRETDRKGDSATAGGLCPSRGPAAPRAPQPV